MNGTLPAPARSRVRNRCTGVLSGQAKCGPPLRVNTRLTVSSIMPIDALTGLRRSISSSVNVPAFTCGNHVVSDRTSAHMAAR